MADVRSEMETVQRDLRSIRKRIGTFPLKEMLEEVDTLLSVAESRLERAIAVVRKSDAA